MDFAFTENHGEKKKRKRNDRQVLGSCQRVETAVEHEGDIYINGSSCSRNGPERLGKDTRGTGNQRKNRDHTEQSIVKIGLNT